MYPEFTIDGVAFTAQRNYTSVQGVPVASVLCTAADPDSLLPPAGKGRRLTQWLVRFGLPALAVLALALLFLWPNLPWLFREPGGWVLLASPGGGSSGHAGAQLYLTWNENGKRGSSRKKYSEIARSPPFSRRRAAQAPKGPAARQTAAPAAPKRRCGALPCFYGKRSVELEDLLGDAVAAQADLAGRRRRAGRTGRQWSGGTFYKTRTSRWRR